MAAGIDNWQVCPPLPESCHPPSGPIRPDPEYGFPELGSGAMPNFPPNTSYVIPGHPGDPDPEDLCCIIMVDGASDSFDCYEAGIAVTLGEGCGWATGGVWNGQINYYGVQAYESWDVLSYGWTGVADIALNA